MALRKVGQIPLRKMLPSRSFASASSVPYDLVIVGGGIVGLSTAREVALRHPHFSIAVVEKERELASHQTGRNSGVIHAGIYYKPGSLKAKLCLKGQDLTYKYCDKKGIPYKRNGKVIVAVDDSELARLQELYERGIANGVPGLRMVGPAELREIEPACRGIMAVHSPNTGIVDWGRVAKSYAEDFKQSGGNIFTDFEVKRFFTEGNDNDDFCIGIQAQPGKPLLTARHVITCCGLYADRVSKLLGGKDEPRIIPFRGKYLVLSPSKAKSINGNIYPVPDPRLPFLGVHLTPRMDGSVWLGPNAVLAFAREGYRSTIFNWRDIKEYLLYSGLWRLGLQYWQFAITEVFKSTVIAAQLREVQRCVPGIRMSDFASGPIATGIQAQAVDGEGRMLDDFVFDRGGGGGEGLLGARTLHVRNAPSPAATSSLAIGEMLADKAQEAFNWTPEEPRNSVYF